MSLNSDLRISFEQLHSMNERATPIKMMHYKLALQLYKNFNDVNQNETWMDLNFQQNFGPRNEFIAIVDTSLHKVGRNNLINRLNTLSGKIRYEWLNYSFDTYKLKCKTVLLT